MRRNWHPQRRDTCRQRHSTSTHVPRSAPLSRSARAAETSTHDNAGGRRPGGQSVDQCTLGLWRRPSRDQWSGDTGVCGFAAYLGTVLFAVAISAVLLRIVSAEYWRDPVTGWYIWASGTAFVLFGTLIWLDREQRANGLLLIVFGILEQLPWTGLMDLIPVWAIFLLELSTPLPWIVLAVVLLRFPERSLEKSYERIFIAVMATWLLSFRAIHAIAWPCWASQGTWLNGLCGL